MNLEDYNKYYQKGGNYLIPKEVFEDLSNDIEELKQENEELKNKLMITTKVESKEIEKNTFVGIDYFINKSELLKKKIDKAIKYIETMFDNGNEKTVIDDLLHLSKLLKGSDE